MPTLQRPGLAGGDKRRPIERVGGVFGHAELHLALGFGVAFAGGRNGLHSGRSLRFLHKLSVFLLTRPVQVRELLLHGGRDRLVMG